MINLGTNVLEGFTRKTVRFVVGPYGFFRHCSRKCVRPLYGTFIDGFAKKALTGPYRSYDNTYHLRLKNFGFIYYFLVFTLQL